MVGASVAGVAGVAKSRTDDECNEYVNDVAYPHCKTKVMVSFRICSFHNNSGSSGAA